ncbi:Multidrug export protein MepA [termite gut metagenome]|uniref:Multidrug export protein MepA n=1 Tax=termite gut metagenome TaxID=433724 RepID=A0A5J4SDK8_9ZZZZ
MSSTQPSDVGKGVKNLTQGTVYKQLLNLSMPIMATSFIQMAYGLTDMAWLGRLGSEYVAAAGSVGILTWISDSCSRLTKTGSEVSISQSIGAQNKEDARSFASHNVTISLLIALCWGSVLFVFAHPIIGFFRLGTSISANAVSYLRVLVTALPFCFLSVTFTGIYNAVGRSNVPFFISATGLLLNIILDPLFIFGFKWGVNGAAYATWVAQATVFILFCYQLRHHDSLFDCFPFFVRLKKRYTRRILKLGIPVAGFNMLFASVSMILGRTASAQGGYIGVVALTTGSQFEAINWNVSQSFSTALGAFVGQNYAAGQIRRVMQAWKTTLRITLVYGSLCTFLFIFKGESLFAFFVPEREAYLAGSAYLRIMGYSQLFMMMEITTQGLFYGVGRTLPPAIVSIVFNYMRIPLALLFVHWAPGMESIWWAICATSIMKGIVLGSWFKIYFPKLLIRKAVRS